MGGETYTAKERTKLVHNGRLVVLQEGQKIPLEQAVELGLAKKSGGKKADKDEGDAEA